MLSVGWALNSLQLLWSCWVLPLLPVIFECCLLGVGAIKSLQECKWVNVELSRCQRCCLSRKGITVLFLVQIATFRKGEEAAPRLVAHLPEWWPQWNVHYSITIYPVWNLPKITFCMTLPTILWIWLQYHNDLVQYWLLFTSTKTILLISCWGSLYNMKLI